MNRLGLSLAILLIPAAALAQATAPSIKAPTSPSQAANKAYVDSAVGAVNSVATSKLSDAPSDSQVYGRSNGTWAAIGAGGSASVTNSSVIAALGYTPTNKTGDLMTGRLSAPSAFLSSAYDLTNPGCDPGAGDWTQNGMATWVPSCYGAFFSSNQHDIHINATRGTPSSNDITMGANKGTPASNAIGHAMIQARANGDIPYQTNGFTVNFDSVGGSISGPPTPPDHPEQAPNASSIMTSVLQRPGPNGERPPSTWALNTDLVISPGSGGVQSYGFENDLNNFNCDSNIASPCGSAWFFYGGINPYPNLAFHYFGNPHTGVYTGKMTRSGNNFVKTSGTFDPKITTLTWNDPFTNAQITNRVSCTTTICTADFPIGTDSTNQINFTGVSSMAHIGLFFQDSALLGSQVSDHDFFMNDSAYNIMYANGHHLNGFNFIDDDLRNALLLKAGQRTCYSGDNACISYSTGLNSWMFHPGNDPATNVARIGNTGDAYFAGTLSATSAGFSSNLTVNGTVTGGKFALPAVGGTAGTANKIDLFGNNGAYGFGISAGSVDYVSTANHTFYVANAARFGVTTAGATVNGTLTVTADTNVSGTTTTNAGHVTGMLTVDGRTHTTGHVTSDLTSSYQCTGASKGEWTYVTDIQTYPGFRNTFWNGGGSISAPVWCNGVNWELH